MSNVKPLLKTTRVEVRLTPAQKEALKDYAVLHNMTVSEYIIHALQLPLPHS